MLLFGIVALSLTFVVITGEIDLSFPSAMALGVAAFCLITAHAERAGLGGPRPCRLARLAASSTVFSVAALNIPSLVITDWYAIGFCGLESLHEGDWGCDSPAHRSPRYARPSLRGSTLVCPWGATVASSSSPNGSLQPNPIGAHVFLVGDNARGVRASWC